MSDTRAAGGGRKRSMARSSNLANGRAPDVLDTDWAEAIPVGDVLVRAASRRPNSTAIAFPELRLTFAQLLDRSLKMGRGLAGLGLRPGDRVGILMPNCPDFVEGFFACQLNGIVVVPINARFKLRELAYVVKNAELVAVMTSDVIDEHVSFVNVLSEAVPVGEPTSVRHLILLGQSRAARVTGRGELDAAAEEVSVEDFHRRRRLVRVRDVALMMFTSGTTANPKGCPLTHESLTRVAFALAERYGLTAADSMWNPLPLFHMGAMIPMLATLLAGGSVCTMTRFDAGTALQQIAREKCTFLYPAFPTITQSLVHHHDFGRTDLSSVRAVLATGAPAALRQVQSSFGHPSVVSSYGLTESGGITASSAPSEKAEDRMNCGLPFRGMEARVVAPESGRDQPPGVRGEIVLRGVGMFEGYHRDPEKTSAVLDPEGWFHTGDLGALDERGRLTFLGRLKDMLKVGGENVAAIEIEAYLQEHPAVKVAQVIGVPDEKLLEVPAAFIELVEGASVTSDEIIQFCRGNIASFKIPRYVRFVTEWPMSATKVQKFKLRQEIMAELGLGES
jgi:fatty-acyl-CoA synthase